MQSIHQHARGTRVATALALAAVLSGPAFASGGGGSGGGGGGGGGGGKTTAPSPAPTPAPAPTSILPTTPPTPDTLMRESFGYANLVRPAGGKGVATPYQTGKSITGFWIEYPGSKDTAWLASGEGQTWRICSMSTNPYEMPSPLQASFGNGCVISEWSDLPIATHPTALMPLTPSTGAYEISINAGPSPLADQYLGFGFTNASVLDANLETSGTLWLSLRGTGPGGTTFAYELHSNGAAGPVLAAGTTTADPFTRLVLRVDPVAHTATASVNEAVLGTFAIDIGTPRFIGIEGVGIVDNLVVRKLP
jgi:hypothetical protein